MAGVLADDGIFPGAGGNGAELGDGLSTAHFLQCDDRGAAHDRQEEPIGIADDIVQARPISPIILGKFEGFLFGVIRLTRDCAAFCSLQLPA